MCADSSPKNTVFRPSRSPVLPDNSPKKPRWIWGTAVLLCLLFCALVLADPPWLKRLDAAFFDVLARMDRHTPESSSVLMVDVDETSLAAVGQWPWPRYRLAAMIDTLAKAAPRSILVDFFFPEPDRTSLSTIQNVFQREFGLDLMFKGVPESMMDNDAYLGHVLAKARSAGAFLLLESPIADTPACRTPGISVQGDEALLDPVRFQGMLCSIEQIQAGLATSGFINVRKDPDGILRRIPVLAKHQGRWHPNMSLAALISSYPQASLEISRDFWGPLLHLSDLRIPVDKRAQVVLRFAKNLDIIPVISAVDILGQRFDPEIVKDKIVLIGSSASGLGDLHHTAVDSSLPGSAAHAVLLENILSGSHYRQPQWEQGYAVVTTLISGGTIIGAFVMTGMIPAVMLTCMSLALFPMLSIIGFGVFNVFLPAAAPFTSGLLILIFMSLSFYALEKHLAENRAKRLTLLKQSMLELMVELAEFRDLETGEHIKRTQVLVKVLAQGLATGKKYPGLNEYYIELMYLCAPLHDVGKIAVPDKILCKPGPLDPEEFAQMQKHVTNGAQIIKQLARKIKGEEILTLGLEMVSTHHEKWDGTGYPGRLSGEEIPLSGRIMALADVYDALTSERVYKKKMTHEKAKEIILNGSGTHFDPAVVQAFL
ncbi:MAG: CHASE2 domain-containing protein, partial [Desulfotignum sp.]